MSKVLVVASLQPNEPDIEDEICNLEFRIVMLFYISVVLVVDDTFFDRSL
jgi:hypothetical protein